MKDITRITLGSLPYNVEIAAKKELEHYCAAIEHSLRADDDAMREIEVRMAELLAERGVSGEKVISAHDVAALREQLGEPEDFADETGSQSDGAESSNPDEKPTKRLMRDMSNRLLGGVCSGIAAYLAVDTAVVRIITAALLFITAGTALPVYLLMWLIIPPARTVSDRLEMAGKPVTLTAIQQESTAQTISPEPPLHVFLRYFVAGLLLLGIIGTVMVMARYGTADFLRYLSMQTPWAIALTVVALLSGTLFMIMLGLLAYALIAKKFTKKMGVALIAIMVAGLSAFTVGVFGLHGDYGSSLVEMSEKNKVEQVLDAAAFTGAKQIVIDAPDSQLAVSYVAATGTAKMTLSYDKRNMTNRPSVTLTKSGETVTLKADTQSNGCMGGTCMPTFLTISGPVLTQLTSNNANVSYTTGGQESLAIHAAGNSQVSVYSSDGQINKVSVVGRDDNMTTLDTASVRILETDLKGSARVLGGHVSQLIITAPDVCSTAMRQPSVLYASSESVTLNGALVGPQDTLKCFGLERDDEHVPSAAN